MEEEVDYDEYEDEENSPSTDGGVGSSHLTQIKELLIMVHACQINMKALDRR